jgi:hypothetical protein
MLEKVIVDNVEYPVDSLTAQQKEMLRLYEIWAGDADRARLEMLKAQSAVRDVSNTLIRNIREMVTAAQGINQPPADLNQVVGLVDPNDTQQSPPA